MVGTKLHDRTITANYHIQEVMPQGKSSAFEKRLSVEPHRILLYHDNAASHKTRAITQYCTKLESRFLHQLAYSSDQITWWIWLFPILKDKLAKTEFKDTQDLAKADNSELRTIPQKECRCACEN